MQDFSFTFIELPKFKKEKIEELDTILDKWCYFFKYASATSEADMTKIASSYKAIGDAYEVVNQYNWDEKQLIAYEQEKKRIWDNIAAMDYQLDKAKTQGMEKGREEGMKEGIKQTAINMLKQNLDNSLISSVTGLSTDEVLKLKNKL